ncbi:MAG: hypothetical protein ACQESO_09840 [Bacillota bacterium]
MTPLFKKLNLKEQKEIFIINSPSSFRSELNELPQDLEIKEMISGDIEISFILAFVTEQEEIDKLATIISSKLKGDGLIWFAYPKQKSKSIISKINREHGWNILGKLGFEPVRQVAIDENWSAIRFRKAQYIKKMVRKGWAISEEGKKKSRTNHD